MAIPLLREVDGALALPFAWFAIDARHTQGLIWDPQRQTIVDEALPALNTFPPRDGLGLDENTLRAHAREALEEAETLEAPTIFGGCLIRHFGHFLHEGFSRLWWLAPPVGLDPVAEEAALQLQQVEGDVAFFMPPWLDQGKNLLPYMEEIFSLLHLPARRIRIIERPLLFRRLLIPAAVWGFGTDPRALDQHFGCDTRALMRHLLASAERPDDHRSAEPDGRSAPAPRVYVTRSGLPIHLGRLIGDVVLDPLLEEAGYRMFHPERATIAEQIRLYSQARDLIFMDGSSLYVLWLAKMLPGTRVRVILRRRQGRWMCEKVKQLLPDAEHVRWEVVDALQGEALTSTNDWESHNVVHLASLLGQLGLTPPTVLPQPAAEALASYVQTLAQQSSLEQLAKVLEALIALQATVSEAPPSRRARLMYRLRGLVGRWRP